MKNPHRVTQFLALSVIVTMLGACSMFSGRETAGQYVDDATITSKIKSKILLDPKLKVLEVNVETMQGVVQLSGFVDSAQSDAKAVAIVNQVSGVKSVQDDLVIR